jgi:hypothetical protein
MLDDYVNYRTGAIPATSTSKSLLVRRPRAHMVRHRVTSDVCGDCDDDETEFGVEASVTPPPTPSPSVPHPRPCCAIAVAAPGQHDRLPYLAVQLALCLRRQ